MLWRERNSIVRALFSSYFLIGMIAIFIMFAISYYFFYQTVQRKSVEFNELMVMSIHDQIERKFTEFDKLTFHIYHSEVHRQLIELNRIGNSPGQWEYQNKRSKLLTPLFLQDNENYLQKNKTSILLYDKFGEIYVRDGLVPRKNGRELLKTEEYQAIQQNLGMMTVRVVEAGEWFVLPEASQHEKVLLIGRKVMNTLQSNELGIILIAVELDQVIQSIDHLLDEHTNSFVLLDHQGKVIFSREAETEALSEEVIAHAHGEKQPLIFKHEGEKYRLHRYYSPLTEWTYINLIAFSEIRKDLQFLNVITSLCAFGAIISSLIIAIYFSRRIIKPILKLENFAYDIEGGHLDTRLTINSYKEFNHLANCLTR